MWSEWISDCSSVWGLEAYLSQLKGARRREEVGKKRGKTEEKDEIRGALGKL